MGRGKKSMSWVSVGADICSRVIKLFFFITDERAIVFAHGKIFQGSLIFVGKYGTYPSGVEYFRFPTLKSNICG